MVGLTRWSPFGSTFHLHREIDELFNRFFGAEGVTPAPRSEGSPVAWWPAIESYTKDGQIHVRVALPGVDPKDVEVTVTDEYLTIRGERKARTEDREKGYLVREFAHGTFERMLALPEGVDGAKVQAKFANGMLELTLPVPVAVAPKKIDIQVESGTEPAKAIKVA